MWERGNLSLASWFSQSTIARVRLYGVNPNGERVPRWIWYGQKEKVSGWKVIRIFCVWWYSVSLAKVCGQSA